MKYLTVLLLFICCHAIAQDVVTTTEEYNYLTRGYKTQLESGLDMKKGYMFGDGSQPITYGNYTFQFRPLVREATGEIAAILLVATSKAWGNNIYYFCLPRNNHELSTRHITELRTLDAAMIRAYAEVTSLMLGEFMASSK